MAPRRGRPHYPLLKRLSGRLRDLTPAVAGIATVFAVKFTVLPVSTVCSFEGP